MGYSVRAGFTKNDSPLDVVIQIFLYGVLRSNSYAGLIMRKGERDHTEKPNLLELLNEELEAIGEAIMLHLCR
ncbi:hypothetical protein W02_27220 [Nitrospira sp. KM1]|nr:hypothetical protein W02_27220 [Nitrospira sp. KM1]